VSSTTLQRDFPASYSISTEGTYSGVKWPEREIHHSLPPSTKVKNAWRQRPTTPPPRLHGKHRKNDLTHTCVKEISNTPFFYEIFITRSHIFQHVTLCWWKPRPTTQHHIPEDFNLQQRCCEGLETPHLSPAL
jgi:hypothetical protein